MDVFLGITGASGAPYARRLAQVLVRGGHTVGACFSTAGAMVAGQELYGDLRMPREDAIARWADETGVDPARVYDPTDFGSPYASGSARWDAAVIVPCSMDTLATVATGAGSSLVHRAASVALKEDRRLVLVPRETPLSTIHLENMLRVRRAGAHLLPAMPAFYQLPESLDDMVDFVVAKACNLLGIDQALLSEWDEGASAGG